MDVTVGGTIIVAAAFESGQLAVVDRPMRIPVAIFLIKHDPRNHSSELTAVVLRPRCAFKPCESLMNRAMGRLVPGSIIPQHPFHLRPSPRQRSMVTQEPPLDRSISSWLEGDVRLGPLGPPTLGFMSTRPSQWPANSCCPSCDIRGWENLLKPQPRHE